MTFWKKVKFTDIKVGTQFKMSPTDKWLFMKISDCPGIERRNPNGSGSGEEKKDAVWMVGYNKGALCYMIHNHYYYIKEKDRRSYKPDRRLLVDRRKG